MRLLHAADLHLDSPFRGLTAEKALQRRRESRAVLDAMAALAKDRAVDAVLLSGDLFDGGAVYRETLEHLSRTLGAMACPVFIAPGNHDPYHSRSPYRQVDWPDNVHLFADPHITYFELPEHNCVIYGAAFIDQRRIDHVLQGFTAPAEDRLQIMCLHADLGEGPYGPVSPEEIALSGLDYLALGHVHQCSGLQKAGSTFYAYPGCPEGRGFDELGEKGVLLIEAERGRVEAEFIPLCRRRYTIVTADVTGRDPRTAAEEVLQEIPQEDLVRLVFTGETGEQGVDLEAVRTAFLLRFFHFEVRDETRVGEALWSRAGEDSLRGLFLADLHSRYEKAADQAEREKIAMAARFGLAAMDGRDM